MDLVSRLKLYLDAKQISVTQFADECGIPRPTGSQLLAGRNKKVSDEIIGKIHQAYPELNIVWLMFGEGDMAKNANIEVSEAQNTLPKTETEPQTNDRQELDFGIEFNSATTEIPSEKSSDIPNTFTFASPTETSDQTQHNQTLPTQASECDEAITLTPRKGKRVTGIVVYYDDCTYESFIPDPSHSHPFIR